MDSKTKAAMYEAAKPRLSTKGELLRLITGFKPSNGAGPVSESKANWKQIV